MFFEKDFVTLTCQFGSHVKFGDLVASKNLL